MSVIDGFCVLALFVLVLIFIKMPIDALRYLLRKHTKEIMDLQTSICLLQLRCDGLQQAIRPGPQQPNDLGVIYQPMIKET